jgi:hypothetical protein
MCMSEIDSLGVLRKWSIARCAAQLQEASHSGGDGSASGEQNDWTDSECVTQMPPPPLLDSITRRQILSSAFHARARTHRPVPVVAPTAPSTAGTEARARAGAGAGAGLGRVVYRSVPPAGTNALPLPLPLPLRSQRPLSSIARPLVPECASLPSNSNRVAVDNSAQDLPTASSSASASSASFSTPCFKASAPLDAFINTTAAAPGASFRDKVVDLSFNLSSPPSSSSSPFPSAFPSTSSASASASFHHFRSPVHRQGSAAINEANTMSESFSSPPPSSPYFKRTDRAGSGFCEPVEVDSDIDAHFNRGDAMVGFPEVAINEKRLAVRRQFVVQIQSSFQKIKVASLVSCCSCSRSV